MLSKSNHVLSFAKDLHSILGKQVLVENRKFVQILTLNRPKQLNVLSSYMVSRLLELFLAYEQDPGVRLIILKGNGRAFCAGGDLASPFQRITQGDWRLGADYFWKEYNLNYVIRTYDKPQVSILNGIVMGGGAGVSVHGRFRVATENTVFAMPETASGLFPDVGASYFLSRLPGFFGEYLGLTGARLGGAEMLACGLATHFVPSVRLPLLEEELCKTFLNDAACVSQIIAKYAEKPALNKKSAYHQVDIINKCFSRGTVEEVLSSLEIEAAKKNDDWISLAIQSLKKASPTSLKITLRSIRDGRLQGIDQCLVREYRMICHVIRGDISRDIFEGVRAMLIDKDKNPKWEPSQLDLVTDSMVDGYFSRVDDKGWEDLKLPSRTNYPPSTLAKL
ncbi:hypothetical protein Cgig2_008962 [Carnegiea gigantea]|uniref:3-hydroxyisobutyryl-CoA hydrolase n=1 Tax=Carnegiea gigantea TaxID=171969 RepID=A0A9Q1K8T2_9CARY|nr:hypothetical protein Cgig2_008962 [Carnegiea gigantea]